jgi:4-alpha-glucanotransferase
MNQSLFPSRQAGLLLHPTSLPGSPGNGTLGPDAYRFVDFMAAAGFGVWQMLPLGPTHEDRSPYQCLSAHAGNVMLVSGRDLVERGWIGEGDLPGPHAENPRGARLAMLRAARAGFEARAGEGDRQAFEAFIAAQRFWLEDYALYRAIRAEREGAAWVDWPAPLRDREPAALETARQRLAQPMAQVRFEQYVFFDQWHRLRTYANERGIRLFGDIPIFVAHDSSDVWAERQEFRLGADGHPEVVTGVPPDYFSETGQRWGNPHYDWAHMAQDGYSWWKQRLRTQLELFDLLRIDHFRGFEAHWEIPADEPTAINGHWVQGPGDALFQALEDEFGRLPLVAEDLGLITEEVHALRKRWHFPGMRILQFAFDGSPDNPYLPHNHQCDSVVYTGTHDNDATVGWYASLDGETRDRVLDYLGRPGEPMPWPMLRSALASVACLCVVPMQDVLGLGSADRMNVPGVPEGNWTWRFVWERVPEGLASRLHHLLGLYGRL